MTATEDCSNVTAIILIQPVSYLQYGQAAYPANLSLGGETHEEPSTKTPLADAVDERETSSPATFKHLYLTVVT